MKILIVDDSTSKLAEITSLVSATSKSFEIDSCVSCIDSLLKLKNKYDLLITDLQLPLRKDEDPIQTGGKYIVDQINRDLKLKPPTYIVGLTQYDELIEEFHSIWKVIKYDPTSTKWQKDVRELLIYVSRQYSSDDRIIIDKIPTIYVEGRTDEMILLESIRLYFPSYFDQVKINQKLAVGLIGLQGQLIIWASSLPKMKMTNI
jgi:CheY-like chemotaxis protein